MPTSPLPEPKETDPAKRRARIASVLTRGFVNHKLNLDWLKSQGLVGQYVRNDANSIAEMEALDFQVYKGENIPKVHGSSDGTVRVGDVILMVTSPENAEDIAFVQNQLIKERHNPKKQAEEKEYSSNSSNIGSGVTPFTESRVEEANADTINAALAEEKK